MAETKPEEPAKGRRSFLKLAGAGSLATVGACSYGDSAEGATADATGTKGYTETSHVKTYYDLTRF